MNTSEVLKNIYGINLSYLLLAQRLIQTDKSSTMFRLGISESMAETLQKLTMAKMVKLAEMNQLLCVFRFEDSKSHYTAYIGFTGGRSQSNTRQYFIVQSLK